MHAADWLLQTLAPLGIAAPPDWDREPWLTVPPATQVGARWHQEGGGEGPPSSCTPAAQRAQELAGGPSGPRRAEYQRLTRLALVVVAGPADDGPGGPLDASPAVLVAGPAGRRLPPPDLAQPAGSWTGRRSS